MIKKAKNSILSSYALRSFVAGVRQRSLNERKRERKRHCPRARENENGFQVFSWRTVVQNPKKLAKTKKFVLQ